MAEQLTVAMNDFCVKLYRIYSEKDGNIFLSPYSISAALLLADLGAGGETDTQIRAALGAEAIAKPEIHRQYKKLESALKGTTTLSVANKIFSKSGLTLDEDYQTKAKEYYDSGVELLDFTSEAEKSRTYINKWVETQTRNKIQNLIPTGAIGPDSLLVLVNAIYFKGKWLKPFHPYSTRKTPFHITNQSKATTDMMNGKENVKYILNQKIGYSAVELEYTDRNISMVIILPQETDGLADIEKKLDSKFMGEINTELMQAGRPEVILRIPKFKMEAQYQLERDLPRLGIVDMFSPTAADFSVMLPNTPNVYISSSIHKTFVEVNEEGTEAVAATGMGPSVTSAELPKPPKQFIADHPFLFMIKNRMSDTVLFIGRYVCPPNRLYDPPYYVNESMP